LILIILLNIKCIAIHRIISLILKRHHLLILIKTFVFNWFFHFILAILVILLFRWKNSIKKIFFYRCIRLNIRK